METFRAKLVAAQSHTKSNLAIGLAPRLDQLPLAIQRFDDPFLPYGKAIIDATRDLACGYVFHLAAYLALGAAGAIALERTIAYVPTPLLKVLHGPFAAPDYAKAAFEDAFDADAVTLVSSANLEMIAPYVAGPEHAVFVEVISDVQLESLQNLAEGFQSQVGFYREQGHGHQRLGVFFDPKLRIDWRWDSAIYVSRGDDFREAIHTAAANWRRDQ